MFENLLEKRNLVIVCEEKNHAIAEYLVQLISLNDDDGEQLAGFKDGSVNATIWTEKQYNDNLATMGTQQHVLFIGDFKASQNIMPNVKIYYNEHTIKYGWLGNKGIIYLPQKGKINKTSYEIFLKEAAMESERISGLKVAGKAALFSLDPVYVIIEAVFLNGLKEKKKIREQLYRFSVLRFYLYDIRKFLGV